MLSDNQDVQWTDSLITLLREKDANTIYMLRVLSETSDSMVSTREIESIIATRQDSVVTNRRVQRRIITHRDTVVTKPKKKGFFRRWERCSFRLKRYCHTGKDFPRICYGYGD